MNRRTLITTALACLAGAFATTLPTVSFAQSNPMMGTWKINLTKSKFSPGPAPKSSTRITEAVGQNFRATFEGINAEGNATKVVFGPYAYDGKPYPVTGTPNYDTASYKQISNTTTEVTLIKAGKSVQTSTGVLSPDGKIYTITTTGVTATGQQINNVAVYDKQ